MGHARVKRRGMDIGEEGGGGRVSDIRGTHVHS